MMKKCVAFILAVSLFFPGFVWAINPSDPEIQQWSYTDVKAFDAWDKATGSRSVVVAVIDNGFDTFHPDIYPNVWQNEDEIPANGVDDDQNGFVDDVWGWDFSGVDRNGDGVFTEDELLGDADPRPKVNDGNFDDTIHHGTLVAGIIGAIGNNGKAGAGINWHVRLMNVKALERAGVGDLAPLERAIRYAVDNGAHIINISLVGDADQRIKDAVKYAYDKGVAVIAASGNNRVLLNVSPVYPVCADAGEKEQWVLGVSAIAENHVLAPFSNVGANCVDLTAPGVNIASTMLYSPRFGLSEQYRGGWNGTSFAAPFVAGTAALIKSINPSWGPKEIYDAILKNVHRTPPTDPAAYQEIYGAGLLQIDKAVIYAQSQKVTGRAISRVLAVDLLTGDATESTRGQTEGERKTKQYSALTGVHEVASYRDGFATFRHVNQRTGEVVLYDMNWNMRTHWAVDQGGKASLVVGNIVGNEDPEIILASRQPGKTLFRVFAQDGALLTTKTVTQAHRGVTLGLIGSGSIQELLVAYHDGSGMVLTHVDKNFFVARTISLPFTMTVGAVAAGDIDGDSKEEYIVGSGAGEDASVVFYDDNGKLLRRFSVYDNGYKGGLSLSTGDYNADKQDDVVVAPQSGKQPIRVWNRRSQKLAQWNAPGKDIRVLSL